MFINEANHIYIRVPMYNFIEYSDNYSATSESLWQFKRDDVSHNNNDLTVNNSQSFKYKAALVRKPPDAVNNTNSSVKFVVPLKYLSNFWRLSEIALINCKIQFELNWIKDWILSKAWDSAKFITTYPKLHAPIVTLSTKDNDKTIRRWI